MISFSDLFFYYGVYLIGIILTSIALVIAKKNKDKIWGVILILNFLSFIILGTPAGYIIYTYFIIVLIRYIYRKIKKKKSKVLLTN
jgi:hypothetical protein